MCGIIAGIKKGNIVQDLIGCLKKLEYRGYDSAGLACFENSRIERYRSVGRVSELEKIVDTKYSNIGIAHTRWATHGKVNELNAHPHLSIKDGFSVCVIHNGIIENYKELKATLIKHGYSFESQTDSEVLAHFLHLERKKFSSLKEALNSVRKKLIGAYALVAICDKDPNTISGTKSSSSLVMGIDRESHQYFLSSDPNSLSGISTHIVFIEELELICLNGSEFTIYDENLNKINRDLTKLDFASDKISLGEYASFMQKEIHEQPNAIAMTLENFFDENSLTPILFGNDAPKIFEEVEQIIIIACGTSYHAGLVAKYWIEELAKVHVSVEIASEFRYRKSVLKNKTLMIGISQSGETADTLAALKLARNLGLEWIFGICNVQESTLIRICNLSFITRAGLEIGVASTKAFTTQLASLFVFALTLAKTKNHITIQNERNFLKQLRHLPNAVASILNEEISVKNWIKYFESKQNVLFLGRGIHYPIAMEGALKLKEISYIHAEAYAAGELKHGPLALIDENMPIIAIAPNDDLVNKLKNNLEEVKARGGKLFIVADQGFELQEDSCTKIITLGDHAGFLSPILHVIPLQLLAYHVASSKGNDVDKPRNLAKSVTVE